MAGESGPRKKRGEAGEGHSRRMVEERCKMEGERCKMEEERCTSAGEHCKMGEERCKMVEAERSP